LRFRSPSAESTREAARRLARAIEAAEETRTVGLVIGLAGPLGAGKTEWVKGLAEGLGIEPDLVASPTFVIASEYAGRRELVHADLYRLDHAAELDAAGFGDWLAPGHVVAIEWADRFPDALPRDRIELSLERGAGAEDERWCEIAGAGPVADAVVRRFERSLAEDGAPWH
jgi:tRNA threonylcarbamoyladenosine biosynthesis protein TsaE